MSIKTICSSSMKKAGLSEKKLVNLRGAGGGCK